MKRSMLYGLLGVFLFASFIGCATADKTGCPAAETSSLPGNGIETNSPPVENASASAYGIEIVSLRMTASDHLLDLRYRVVDAKAATPIFDRQNQAYLIDEATGIKLPVPRMAKVGPLRQTNFNPDPRRTYFILFSNSQGVVTSGSRLRFEVGDCKIENLVVQ